LPVVEGINAARAEGLLLEQKRPHAPQVHTKLYGVIAHDFRPGIGEIDVGFRTNPGQAGGESNQRIRKSAVDGDADNAAGDLVEIDTRDAEVCPKWFCRSQCCELRCDTNLPPARNSATRVFEKKWL